MFYYQEIKTKIQDSIILKSGYTASLVLLFGGIIFNELLSGFLQSIPSTTITFSDLLLILFDLTTRDTISNKITEHMFQKEKNKLETYSSG